jgi:hypothetical protein
MPRLPTLDRRIREILALRPGLGRDPQSLYSLTRQEIYEGLKSHCSYPGVRKAIARLEKNGEVIACRIWRGHYGRTEVAYALDFKGLVHFLANETDLERAREAVTIFRDIFGESIFPFFARPFERAIGPSIYKAFIGAAKFTIKHPPLPSMLDLELTTDNTTIKSLDLEIARDQSSPYSPDISILKAGAIVKTKTNEQRIEEKKEELKWLKEKHRILRQKRREYLRDRKAPNRLWRDAFGLSFIKICPWPSRTKMQKIISGPQISQFMKYLLRNAESRLEITRKAIESEEKDLQTLRATIFGRAHGALGYRS